MKVMNGSRARQILVTAGLTTVAFGASLAAAAPAKDPHAGHTTSPKVGAAGRAPAADPHAAHRPGAVITKPVVEGGPKVLPAMPERVPEWLYTRERGHVFYKKGSYNFDVYNIPTLARDLNAVAVGHAMAYEDLVTGKAGQLETKTFNRINWVLKNPPKLMPDEAAISPTFVRKYGVLELVFDWTHILHAQTVDVLASTELTDEEKDREIEALWRYYQETVPWKVTPLPMNMGYLYGQSYSKAFRDTYPKVNGLFWGYHWLQGAMYDLLYEKNLEQQRAAWGPMRQQYHGMELYRTDRPFMPMFAELSPRFARKFPHLSNAFDNLHMLHDMINDVLASEWIPEEQKDEQILRAVWMLSTDAHSGEKAGDVRELNGLHDHRFMPGMPGMGMMPAGHGGHSGHGAKSAPGTGQDPHAGHKAQPAKAPAADPHAGHKAKTPKASASDPHAGHKTNAPKAPKARAADPHAGHRMPATSKSGKGQRTRPKPEPAPAPKGSGQEHKHH